MSSFSDRSMQMIGQLDERLQAIMFQLIQVMDVVILEGHRGKETQDLLYHQGKSKVMWPDSKHNTMPSQAVDVAPYPIDWNDRERFVFMCGIIKGIAHELQIPIRMGIDWDGDNDLYDQTFNDLPHIELR